MCKDCLLMVTGVKSGYQWRGTFTSYLMFCIVWTFLKCTWVKEDGNIFLAVEVNRLWGCQRLQDPGNPPLPRHPPHRLHPLPWDDSGRLYVSGPDQVCWWQEVSSVLSRHSSFMWCSYWLPNTLITHMSCSLHHPASLAWPTEKVLFHAHLFHDFSLTTQPSK